jgi:hypothetical protein
MANKFLLVPEEVYQGLTAPITHAGDPNLEFSHNLLQNIDKLKLNPNKKNAFYNQELQRYRHLRREHEQKPVHVLVANQQEAQISQPDFDLDSTEKSTKRKRTRRSRAPSPESPEPKKKARLNINLGFNPKLWN